MKLRKITALMMAAVLLFSLAGCKNGQENGEETTEQTTQKVVVDTEETIILWYTDAFLTEYLEKCVADFTAENPLVTINLKLMSSSDYLENVNTECIKSSDKVDLYVLSNCDLEQAYLAGLTTEVTDTDIYNEENYGSAAISSVTYKNKMIAYPFWFDSAFMVYNQDYTDTAPQTFQDILDFANNLIIEDENSVLYNIESVLRWDVSDIELNYQFLSDYFTVGGDNGDNREDTDMCNDYAANSMAYYQSLSDFFAIDRKDVTYTSSIDYFINGKSVFTIARADALSKLNDAKMNYAVCRMPDITAELPASALSETDVVVVNPYSDNVELAKLIAQAVTYDYAGSFYELTGSFPAYSGWEYDSAVIDGVYDNYRNSISKAKFINMGDFYTRLEIMMHSIWDGEDIYDQLTLFKEYATEQLN